MAKPIINSLEIMSCNEVNTISFVYSGGLLKSNTVQIISAQTNQVVATNTVTTALMVNTLPANLVNVEEYGTQYYIQVQVVENDGTVSSWSDSRYVIFITSPTFEFANIISPLNVEQSFLDVELNYSQSEDELLKDYLFEIYDSGHNLLSTSDTYYDTSSLVYRYIGLEQGIYYIRARGSTVNGYILDTGYFEIDVKYTSLEIYSTLFLTNNYNKGTITYKTNIVSIDYYGDEVFEYVDNYIDLTNKQLLYDRGFNIENNGTFIVKGKNYNLSGVKFLEIYDSALKYGFYITSYIYDDDSIRFKLVANNGLSDYILYSPAIQLENSDDVSFFIRKKDDLYLFKVFVNGEVIE